MRYRGPVAFVLAVAFVAAGFGADSPEKWDVKRTTPPNDSTEAKALQTAIKAMVEKTTPSTVALFYQAGAGSGAIVSEDGLILTAAHVVSPMPGDAGGGGRQRRGGGGVTPGVEPAPPKKSPHSTGRWHNGQRRGGRAECRSG